MNRHTRAGRELLACILSMSLILPGTALAVTNQDVKDAKNQAASIEEEKKKAEQTLAGLESLKADTAAYVKQLDASLEQTAQEISNIQSQIETKEGEIAVTKEELEAAKQTEEEQYKAMKLRIQYMYEKGDTNYIDMLLEAESFSDMLNKAEYINQISQYDLPLCENGYLDIETGEGRKRVGITRIHIEEDAGKLIHQEGKGTLIDYNRCGVPLIEIVSEPDFRSVEEIKAYLQKLRATILYTGVSDCKMNEGSLRVDVNLSVRKKGEETLGTRTEMKNLNSFQFIARAVEYEFRRQVEALEAGEEIIQETRRFDQASGKTFSMRRKEDANDYRYFPDPDLPPIEVSPDLLRELQAQIPVLPDQRKKEYVKRFGLTDYAAEQITLSREAADYFEQAARRTRYPKLAANLVLSEVMRLMPADGGEIPVAPEHLGKLADLFGDGRINSGTCRQAVAQLW